MSVNLAKSKIIGLTGGIATGKSTVSSYLIGKGYIVIDSDKIVHHLWVSHQLMIKQVKLAFSLNNQQDLRKQVADIVFGDLEKLNQLNQIVHPFVFEEIDKQLKLYKEEKIIFIDMPLLFEINYQSHCDKTWLVYAPRETQLNRMLTRDNLTENEALKRINAQMSIEEKKNLATKVIDNDGSMKHLYKQIDKLLDEEENEE
ncbi:dephospho-CoA kinase [Mycoplasmatota bacterium]|nr:dephospho-CoA kinase [Mycoplasmatota bacterium]